MKISIKISAIGSPLYTFEGLFVHFQGIAPMFVTSYPDEMVVFLDNQQAVYIVRSQEDCIFITNYAWISGETLAHYEPETAEVQQ